MESNMGKIFIVGFGPGHEDYITDRAKQAIAQADLIVGYHTYVDLVKPLIRADQDIIRTGMTEEVDRAQAVVREAVSGKNVAIISSGDAGVYGMAGLIYEVLVKNEWREADGPSVEVVPGISAINSCASLLGAPVMHDSALISLSDHLTPWEVIAQRLEAAAQADFVVALYNPKSGRRTQQIVEAQNIFLRHRDPKTPVGLVKSAYRDRQNVILTTLDEMVAHDIGMLTTVIIGNSSTFVYEGKMITPRGYQRKYDLTEEEQALKNFERLKAKNEPWAMHGGDENVVSQARKIAMTATRALRDNKHSIPASHAVLFVGHGSRDSLGNEKLLEFVERLKKSLFPTPVVTAFIEFADPGLDEGFRMVCETHATDITVVPLMLLAAGHVKEDIPQAIARASERYPHVRFRYAEPVGVDQSVVGSIADTIDAKGLQDVTRTGTLLMVGRGSSDLAANSDFYKLSRLVWEKSTVKKVEICFVGVTEPTLDDGLDAAVRGGQGIIYVLPYLIFPGILLTRINDKVRAWQEKYPDVQFVWMGALGEHEAYQQVTLDRIRQVQQAPPLTLSTLKTRWAEI